MQHWPFSSHKLFGYSMVLCLEIFGISRWWSSLGYSCEVFSVCSVLEVVGSFCTYWPKIYDARGSLTFCIQFCCAVFLVPGYGVYSFYFTKKWTINDLLLLLSWKEMSWAIREELWYTDWILTNLIKVLVFVLLDNKYHIFFFRLSVLNTKGKRQGKGLSPCFQNKEEIQLKSRTHETEIFISCLLFFLGLASRGLIRMSYCLCINWWCLLNCWEFLMDTFSQYYVE